MCGFDRFFPEIHFVDFPMKRSAADAEFFGSGSDIAVGGGKRLGDQPSFGLVQVERTRFFAESLNW